MDYIDFLQNKQRIPPSCGFEKSKENMNPMMFEWQKDITRWALRKGRAALFEDCGNGKTFQQLEFAHSVSEATGMPVLIVAPLTVGEQTQREATALKHMVLYSGMDATEAHWLMDAWEYRKSAGTDDGYSKYNKLYEAVQSGKNLEAVIKEYVDNGVQAQTIRSQLTEYFKPQYMKAQAAERTRLRAKLTSAMVACGIDSDATEEKLAGWDFEAEYGFA